MVGYIRQQYLKWLAYIYYNLCFSLVVVSYDDPDVLVHMAEKIKIMQHFELPNSSLLYGFWWYMHFNFILM
jgi:hypothetical protein